MSVDEIPLLLGHVCSAWWQISHSTPYPWSTIHINYLGTPSVSAEEIYCEAVEAWLHRSSNLPLSISIAGNNGVGNLLSKLIGVVFVFSPRWKRLALKFRSYYKLLSSMKGVNTPLLTAITINISLIGGRDEKVLDAVLFLNTSSLRAISFAYTSHFL